MQTYSSFYEYSLKMWQIFPLYILSGHSDGFQDEKEIGR